MSTSGGTSPARNTRISPAMAGRIVRALAPLRCHLCTVPYGHGTLTDERPFGCSICLEVRRLVAELRIAAGQAVPHTTTKAAERRGAAPRGPRGRSTPESGL
jgi:hypothetical protein